jgi:hypothetical protein
LAEHLRHQAAALTAQPAAVSVLPALPADHTEPTAPSARRLLPILPDLAGSDVAQTTPSQSRFSKKGRKR